MLLTPQPDRNTPSTATKATRRKVAERTMRFLRQDDRRSVKARRDNSIDPLVVPAAGRFGDAWIRRLSSMAVLTLLILPAPAPAQDRPALAPPITAPVLAAPTVAAPVLAQHGMVASQEARA